MGKNTFVVTFVGDPSDSCKGRVRHVSSGEEIVFSSAGELLTFFDGMNVAAHLRGASSPLSADNDTGGGAAREAAETEAAD